MKKNDIIVEVVEREFGLNPKEKTNKQRYVEARRFTARLLRDEGNTVEKIGAITCTHHATVLYHLRKFNDLIEVDKPTRDKYIKLVAIYKGRIASLGLPKVDKDRQIEDLQRKVFNLQESNLELIKAIDRKYAKPPKPDRLQEVTKVIRQKLDPKRKFEFIKRIQPILNSMISENS